MKALTPRVVFVIRETGYEGLMRRRATREQARFFLRTRGQTLEGVEAEHQHFSQVMRSVRLAVPEEWRQALVQRADLDRFLFAPDDIVVAVGQDGLVANVAKYLDGQPVLGINPDPDRYDGVLVRLRPERLRPLLPASLADDAEIERRTMVEIVLDSGERLRALNEIFVGHRSHQSARYRLETSEASEDQSSSGLIVASGTGATGWARSIMEATHTALRLDPQEKAVGFFVREPFPSVATGTSLRAGKLAAATLSVISRMNEGGTIFADGMEQDHIGFDFGRTARVGPSERVLRLVVG